MPDPVLRTERLVLRPPTLASARALLGQSSDAPHRPDPLSGGSPSSSSPSGFPSGEDRVALTGFVAAGADARGLWVVEHAGEPLGTVSAAGPVSPSGDQEIAYALVPDARGQGLGTEAVGAVCAVLERAAGVRRLTAEVLPGNAGSVRLLRRLGFVEVDGGSPPHVLLARAAPGAPPVRQRLAGRHVC